VLVLLGLLLMLWVLVVNRIVRVVVIPALLLR
jgi:hypothetical protein